MEIVPLHLLTKAPGNVEVTTAFCILRLVSRDSSLAEAVMLLDVLDEALGEILKLD